MKQLFINGQVFTGEMPLQTAFAMEGDRFVAVGSDGDILALRQEGDTLTDLAGQFVCAGFNDSHMHLLNYGNAMGVILAIFIGILSAVQFRLAREK